MSRSDLEARAAFHISDTYFLEWLGVKESQTALQARIDHYSKLLAETQAFAATLTPEEYAVLAEVPKRESSNAKSLGASQ